MLKVLTLAWIVSVGVYIVNQTEGNMNSNGTEDLRVQKTMTAIYQAFEELILTTDYEKITVAELARRARINKKTFHVMAGSLLR
ncbi:hypothetical protein NOF63_06315 [Limosilactobacillus fermentum]|uniref:hypothetical protein n=1 Tax=Limosilactobacillus fermentum TaxID=1613 RepID=UPI002102DB3D|nr:hypothetical protein [Limosilactobacillus fermentum]MCQ2007662.1 hypothetical protein [Limosilactobacillus fermentum]